MDYCDRSSRQGISGHVRKTQSMYCLSLNSSGSDAHRPDLCARELCSSGQRYSNGIGTKKHISNHGISNISFKQTQLQTIVPLQRQLSILEPFPAIIDLKTHAESGCRRVLPVPNMQLPRLRIIDIKVASQSNIPLITLELR